MEKKQIRIIAVPYHLGRKGISLGLGPMNLIDAGLQDKLEKAGHKTNLTVVHRGKSFINTLNAIKNVNENIASAVKECVKSNEFPLILAGDCNSCIGTLAGLNIAPIGVVWFDAHGDFNTPEISLSGYFDGMPLAIITGNCYNELWHSITQLPAIRESEVILIGVRDLDPKEKHRLEKSEIIQITPKMIRSMDKEVLIRCCLDKLRSRVEDLYLHIDLDALDPSITPCNAYQPTGGLYFYEMLKIIKLVDNKFKIRAAALTAFDPAFDIDGRTRKIGVKIASYLAEL